MHNIAKKLVKGGKALLAGRIPTDAAVQRIQLTWYEALIANRPSVAAGRNRDAMQKSVLLGYPQTVLQPL
jgi:hypothetical protein